MTNWIKAQNKLPEPHQHILATIMENGKPTVVACWYSQDNKIKIKEGPNSPIYCYSIVHAWIPFPKPFVEEEMLMDTEITP